MKPPGGIGKKNASKLVKDAIGKRKGEQNRTPSRSGLRDFLGSGESPSQAVVETAKVAEPGNVLQRTNNRKREGSPLKNVKKAKAPPESQAKAEGVSDLRISPSLLEAIPSTSSTSPLHLLTTSSNMPLTDSTSPKPVPLSITASPSDASRANTKITGSQMKEQVQARVKSPEGAAFKSRLANLPIAVVQSKSPEGPTGPPKLVGLPVTVALATSPTKIVVSSRSPTQATSTTQGIPTVSQPIIAARISPSGITRPPIVGAVLRPRLPPGASRPSLVAVRAKQSSLRLVTKLPAGVRPNIPLSRPTLLVARPGLRPVRPIQKAVNVSQAVAPSNDVFSPPTSTKPSSVPILNKTASDEEIVMLADADTESFEDLPNNMIKLIKVNEDKDSSSKEKTEDERMDDESFMDMFDDETRKLAETFDMFEPTNSSKNGDDNNVPKKTMEDNKPGTEQNSTKQVVQPTRSQDGNKEAQTPLTPATPGTPGTPKLVICTPGSSTPKLRASTQIGSPATGSALTPNITRGAVQLRGMRSRGGQLVAIRGGQAVRLRMPLRVPLRGGVASLAARPRGAPAPASRMRSIAPMSGRPALLRPSSRGATPRAMVLRPTAPRPVLVRAQHSPSTTVSQPVKAASGSESGTEKEPTDILLTKDTTPVNPKKEAAEVIDLGEEETTPPAPKRKAAMAKLTHLGISVSRKKGEAGSTSHSSLPQAVVQSPSVTKPAAAAVAANDNSKKVTVELSESQIKALKALGMM